MGRYRPKKQLGQHFLISADIIDQIVALLELNPEDDVVEIGSGQGALTLPLANSGARVVAVEFDRDLAPVLGRKLESYDRAEVICLDFLRFEPEQQNLTSFKLAGNLPYNITSPVLDWCVRYRKSIIVAALMMQRELADRVAARPGGRDWSPLSIFSQIHFDVAIPFDVGPENFDPPPEVHSSVVLLKPRARPLIELSELFDRVVRSSFKQRRKQLVNNLVPGLIASSQKCSELLAGLGVPHTVRAEELSIEQFLKLTQGIAAATIKEK